jgi:hypothetical protein
MSKKNFLPGDWECLLCAAHNFRSRATCYNCEATKSPYPAEPKAVDTEVEDFPPKSIVEKAEASSTSSGKKVRELLLAVDIERKGKHFHHGILAIGACFGDSDGNILEQRAFCSKVPPKDEFEKRTWDEFWSKYPEVLSRIDAAAVPDAIGAFKTWVLELEKKHGPFGRKHKDKVKFKLVSDNPAYDIGMINLELFKTEIAAVVREILEDDFVGCGGQHWDNWEDLGPDPLHKLRTIGKGSALAEIFDDYVPTDDPSEQICHMTPAQKQLVEGHVTAVHDHWPVSDATHIYQERCGIKRVAEATTVMQVKKGKTIRFTEDCEIVYVNQAMLAKNRVGGVVHESAVYN